MPGAVRRAAAFGRAFAGHITRLRGEPHAYGELGLADLFEMREECLREFGFEDVYRWHLDKVYRPVPSWRWHMLHAYLLKLT